MHLIVWDFSQRTLDLRDLHASAAGFVVDIVEVLQHEMIVIHVSPHASDDNVAVLLHPKGVLLPAGLIPLRLCVGACRRDVADHDRFHASVADELQLDAQPLHLTVPGF